MFMSMMLNIIFLSSNSPLILGLVLLMQTISIIMMIGKINYTFWFSYVIFLIFIGGLLILFIYTISLINNKIFIIFKTPMVLILMSSIMFMYYPMVIMNNYEMNLFMKFNLLNENSLNMIKLYSFPNFIINIKMIMYLFFIMIVTNKITNYSMGPFFKI